MTAVFVIKRNDYVIFTIFFLYINNKPIRADVGIHTVQQMNIERWSKKEKEKENHIRYILHLMYKLICKLLFIIE